MAGRHLTDEELECDGGYWGPWDWAALVAFVLGLGTILDIVGLIE